jgi:hypothetical protein
MKCRDFVRLINEQIDARGAISPDLERALESHGLVCAACRAEALRYQTLRQAIAAWSMPPVAPPDFADRFLESWQQAGSEPAEAIPRPTLKLWPALLPIAAAASLLLAVLVGLRSGLLVQPKGAVSEPRLTRAIDSDALSSALAEATTATWDLARETSAPAARVGLEIFDAPGLVETTVALPLAGEAGLKPEVVQELGERIDDGFRPISGTARSAFGFLLGPALPPPEAPPPPSRGA